MLIRIVFMALVLSMLAGCGRRDQPTVRRNVGGTDDETRSSAAASPSADSTPSKSSSVARSQAADATPPSAAAKTPANAQEQTLPQKSGATTTMDNRSASSPASSNVSASANDGDRSSPPKTDRAAPKTSGASPAKTDGQKPVGVSASEVRFGGIAMTAPKTWIREQPSVKFILAEFRLPHSKGDSSDAQLTVTMAAKDAKGQERLREQLKEEEQSKESSTERLNIAGHEVYLVDSSEDDSEDAGDSVSPPTKEGRSRSLNAMVFLGESVYFVNCSGPEKTVAERAGEFRAFLETMKAVQ